MFVGALRSCSRIYELMQQPVKAAHKLTLLYHRIYSGNLISFGRIPFGAVYLIKQKYKEEYSLAGGIGNILLTVADIAGGVFFISEKVPIKCVLPYGRVVPVLYIAAYLPIGLNAVLILADEKTPKKMKVQAGLDLTNSFFQIMQASLNILKPTDKLMVPLALLTGTIGATSFTHRILFMHDQHTSYSHTVRKVKRLILRHTPLF